jgi:hypothetical protein
MEKVRPITSQLQILLDNKNDAAMRTVADDYTITRTWITKMSLKVQPIRTTNPKERGCEGHYVLFACDNAELIFSIQMGVNSDA